MRIHIVQKGDTLWNIAKKYGVDFTELKQANTQLANPDLIMPGMKIKVPTANIHHVKEAIQPNTHLHPNVNIHPTGKKEAQKEHIHPFSEIKPYVTINFDTEFINQAPEFNFEQPIAHEPIQKEQVQQPEQKITAPIEVKKPVEKPIEKPVEIQKPIEKPAEVQKSVEKADYKTNPVTNLPKDMMPVQTKAMPIPINIPPIPSMTAPINKGNFGKDVPQKPAKAPNFVPPLPYGISYQPSKSSQPAAPFPYPSVPKMPYYQEAPIAQEPTFPPYPEQMAGYPPSQPNYAPFYPEPTYAPFYPNQQEYAPVQQNYVPFYPATAPIGYPVFPNTAQPTSPQVVSPAFDNPYSQLHWGQPNPYQQYPYCVPCMQPYPMYPPYQTYPTYPPQPMREEEDCGCDAEDNQQEPYFYTPQGQQPTFAPEFFSPYEQREDEEE